MTKKANSFDKMTLVKSKRFIEFRDVLAVVLKDDKHYTFAEVEKLIKMFLSKEVK